MSDKCDCYYCSGGSFDEQEVWEGEGEKQCPICFHNLWHSHCWNGCDEGLFDGYEEDPLWYDEGEFYACYICNGTGILTFCPACEKREEDQQQERFQTQCFV